MWSVGCAGAQPTQIGRMYTVYIHRNKQNNKCYVGQTGQVPEKRWDSGCGYLKQNRYGEFLQPHFANAIKKYGWKNFEHIIWADGLTIDEANTAEELLIALFNTTDPRYGYNIHPGGSNHNHVVSDKSRKRMSRSQKRRRGIRFTQEERKRMSEARKGKRTGANHPNAKAVSQYDVEGRFLRRYACRKDAEEATGAKWISSCCTGNALTSGGYIWAYDGVDVCDTVERLRDSKIFKHVYEYDEDLNLTRVFLSARYAEFDVHNFNIGYYCSDGLIKEGEFYYSYKRYDFLELKVAQ